MPPDNPEAPQKKEAAAPGRPAKRRRGGRRATNPEISVEERKRQRVLKNRESAMRSLAKKAEYSAKLEEMQADAKASYKSERETLERLIANALTLRPLLDKVPGDVANFLKSEAESAIAKGVAQLADDGKSGRNAKTVANGGADTDAQMTTQQVAGGND